MPVWTGNYHDNENVGAALKWAGQEHQLEVVPLADGEREKWDAKLKPMEAAWVAEMTGKGLPADKYMARLHELRNQMAKE
jgi:hypothetical protein